MREGSVQMPKFGGGILWSIVLAHWPDEWADRGAIQGHEEYTHQE